MLGTSESAQNTAENYGVMRCASAQSSVGNGTPQPRNQRNGSEYGDNFHRRGRYADLSSSKLLGVWSEKRQQKPEMKMMKSMRLIMYAVNSVGVVYRYEPLSNN